MERKYEWIPFYEAFASKLLEYSDRREELFNIIKKVSSSNSLMNYLHFDKEEWWGGRQNKIDPFSVMAIFNRGIKDKNRTEIAKMLANELELDIPAPSNFDSIPLANNMSSFFGGNDEIWDLFKSAIESADSNTFTEDFKNNFDKALSVSGLAIGNLTIGLYWIRPNFFMPLDKNSRSYLRSNYGINISTNKFTGENYINLLKNFKKNLEENSEEISFPEVSFRAWKKEEDIIKQQKNKFIKWYEENYKSKNTAQTISYAISKTKLKNGQSVFSITTYDDLKNILRNENLEEYIQTNNGDYSKLDKILDIEETVKRDDLKSGIKYYLSFLKGDVVYVPVGQLSEEPFIHNKNTILYGTPGTGKTYSSIQYAVAIIEEKPLSSIKSESYSEVFNRFNIYKEDGLIAFTTFHQSFAYEEFIEGIRPTVSSNLNSKSSDIEYEIHNGIFKEFCYKAGLRKSDASGNYKITNRVFIIDEINRGNISKIFGELITLIEPCKRIGAKEELKVTLPYSEESFGVPENVYIIGTMNTADRSIARMDTALRRRFNFVEILPDSDTLRDIIVEGINISQLLNTLNKRITILLDREHTIGHSFFIPLKEDKTIEKLASIFKNEIIPLLQEYFYDDYERIQLILGDNQKSEEKYKFIVKCEDTSNYFGGYEVGCTEYFEINNDAFKEVKSYDFLK